MLHQQRHLAVGVVPDETSHVPDVLTIHGHYVVVMTVIVARHTSGTSPVVYHAVHVEDLLGPFMDVVAQLLRARGTRCYLEGVLQTPLSDHILHYELGHRTAADVAVTYEQDADDHVRSMCQQQ